MLNNGCCREIPNRLVILQRLGIRILAIIGYFSICVAIGASFQWYKHRSVKRMKFNYTMPMVQMEDVDIRMLIEVVDESEPETIECWLRQDIDNTAATKSTFYSIGSCASYHWPWMELKKRKEQIIL